jgi:hypothetical protein
MCKGSWPTYSAFDAAREKKFSLPICPSCRARHYWKLVFDVSTGGVLPPNLRGFEAARPATPAPATGPEPIKGGRVRRANYLEKLKILADGNPHTRDELAPAGEQAITTLSRLRRMVVAGTIRKENGRWRIGGCGEKVAAPPPVVKLKRPGAQHAMSVLSDGLGHTFGELVLPGEHRKAAESRLRRLLRAGQIVKEGRSTWRIATAA